MVVVVECSVLGAVPADFPASSFLDSFLCADFEKDKAVMHTT